MNHELIVNILGVASNKALCNITACISDHGCNILDSRQAQYGTDFSLSLIVSGYEHKITLLELALNNLCVEHDLLCLMKRTRGHQKQNIEQIINITFSGLDASGVMYKVVQYLSEMNVNIQALRQKTIEAGSNKELECKMVLSAPKSLDLKTFDTTMIKLLNELNLHGKISHQDLKENYEHIESW